MDWGEGRLGLLKTIGFLGVWLREGHSKVSRGEHSKLEPTEAKIAEYMTLAGVLDWDVSAIELSPL